MLTFSALPGSACKLSGSGFSLAVFGDEKSGSKGALLLKSKPDEEEKEGVISWPGEYNVMGVSIKGIGQKEGQQVSYVVDADDVRALFLSDPVEDWSDDDIETVGDADVLVAPVSEG